VFLKTKLAKNSCRHIVFTHASNQIISSRYLVSNAD